ncbi:MAG: peptidoglycan editing factor PgeF [Deltaproteobacteria bacterium]|nr:peptidoglycan editing factor PgeF [Deltaproteobacteria bacterium]MBN2686751.1 peptidoglycan editing factor PgeF [Deltaproteobacteria bacterium]
MTKVSLTEEKPMVSLASRGGVRYLEAASLKRYDSIVHAFCTRWGGVSRGRFSNFNFSVSEGDGREQVEENWAILSNAFAIPEASFVTVRQVHEDGILIIDDDAPVGAGGNGEYDAIVTNRPGIAVGVKTADCVPLLLFDPVRTVIAAVHAGWRGTAKGIAATTISRFRERYSTRVEDLIAVIGPSIGPCCYEVDRIVRDAMKDDGAGVFTPSDNHDRWMFDLPRANWRQILDAGVPPANIIDAAPCTSCHRDIFFSHRGEGGTTGRQFNFIMIR